MNDDPELPEPPADPGRDQKITRLRDLERFRELIDPYVTDSSADVREALDRMPPAERAEAENILGRLGTLDPKRRADEERLLHELASLEVTLQGMLDRHTDPEVIQVTQDTLAIVEHWRNQITGLGEDSED